MSYASEFIGTYFPRNPLSTELTACFLPLFLSRMKLSHAEMCAWCIVKIIFFLNMHSFVHFGKRIQRVNLFEKKIYYIGLFELFHIYFTHGEKIEKII